MKLLWHFIRRDYWDHWLGWCVILLLSVIALALFNSFITKYAFAYFITIAAIYFAFSLFHSLDVWGGQASQGGSLSRVYLLSLPVSRKKTFWLCLFRGMIGTIPLAILLLIVPIIALKVQNEEWTYVREYSLTPFKYFLYTTLVVVTILFVQLFACRLSLFNENIRRTVGHISRFWRYLQYLFIDNILGIFATFSAIGALPLLLGSTQYAPCIVLLVGGLIFNLWQLQRSYVEWLFE